MESHIKSVYQNWYEIVALWKNANGDELAVLSSKKSGVGNYITVGCVDRQCFIVSDHHSQIIAVADAESIATFTNATRQDLGGMTDAST